MITWLNLFEISLLIHLQLFELDQKRNFEKVQSSDHQFGWIKSETACICFTWLPPPYSLLDQKLYPAYQGSADHPPFCSVTRTLICSLKKHFYEIEIILRKHLILNWTLYKWVIHVSRNWKLKGSPVFFIFLRRVWLYKCRVNSEKFQNFHFWAQIVIFEWNPRKL